MPFTMRSSLYLSLVTAASAINIARQEDSSTALERYFVEICLPGTSSGDPDLNAPCNAVEAIVTQCAYGSTSLFNNTTDPRISTPRVSPEQEKNCICQSQWFAMFNGCTACAVSHGIGSEVPQVSASALSSFSSSYCAATNTPTAQFELALVAAFPDAASAAATQTATSFSDPIGSRTDVSLYFTAPVTGSSAYIVSQPAVTDSAAIASAASNTMMITSGTSSGQTAASAGASSTSRSSTGLAAIATPYLEKMALAGAVGLVGAVAML